MMELFIYLGGVVLGVILGMFWKSSTVGQLKHENERLNAELKRWTDRDERGRFVKREYL